MLKKYIYFGNQIVDNHSKSMATINLVTNILLLCRVQEKKKKKETHTGFEQLGTELSL